MKARAIVARCGRIACALTLFCVAAGARAQDIRGLPNPQDRSLSMVEGGILLRLPLSGNFRAESASVLEVGAYGHLRVQGPVDLKGDLLPILGAGATLEPVALFRVDLRARRLTQVQLGLGNRVVLDDVTLTSDPHIVIDRNGRGVVFDSSTLMPFVNGRPVPEYYDMARDRLLPRPRLEMDSSAHTLVRGLQNRAIELRVNSFCDLSRSRLEPPVEVRTLFTEVLPELSLQTALSGSDRFWTPRGASGFDYAKRLQVQEIWFDALMAGTYPELNQLRFRLPLIQSEIPE